MEEELEDIRIVFEFLEISGGIFGVNLDANSGKVGLSWMLEALGVHFRE